MSELHDAILLALDAHRGQTDKAGLPYILHPLRVMASFVLPEDDDARVVAVLHDVVEDTRVGLVDLRELGYKDTVIDAIDALSRRKGEDYLTEYIPRVKQNALAARVKLADLADNLDYRRRSTVEMALTSAGTLAKYRAAVALLSNPASREAADGPA